MSLEHPKPHHACKTQARCNPKGLLERCEICRRGYYFAEKMTFEEGEAWRKDVLDSHYRFRDGPNDRTKPGMVMVVYVGGDAPANDNYVIFSDK